MVARGDRSVPAFSLNTADADEPPPDPVASTKGPRAGAFVKRWVPGWRIWISWSIAPFYGALLVLGIGVLTHTLVK